MILEQMYLACLSQASYFIADPAAGVAAVVDPRRDIDEYLARAQALGVEIRYALLTHFHADFASGHLELREHCGAEIRLGAGARAAFPFVEWQDGETIELGSVQLRCLATPGHTPESISILVFDTAVSRDTPQAVLTGDTLFIGDAGRPDLLGSVGHSAEEMAGRLYASLREKIMPLPPETIVYPGHGAGSACGKNLGSATFSTIGAQLRENYALAPMPREEFIASLTADQPVPPPYFPHDVGFNRSEHATLAQTLERAARPLTSEEFFRARAGGAQVLDVRPADEYAAGHLRGSVQVGLGGKFATWCGTVLDLDRPLLLIAAPGTEREAIVRLGRIGIDSVLGYLDGGFAAITGADRKAEIATVGRIEAAVLDAHLATRQQPGSDHLLLDVRTPGEFAAGAVPGAVHLPLAEFAARVGELPASSQTTVYCAGGYRSVIAMSLLEAQGRPGLVDVIGGYGAWQPARRRGVRGAEGPGTPAGSP